MMRIGLSTAPLAFRLRGAGGSAVDNPTEQGFHLRNPKTCPNKPGHLCYSYLSSKTQWEFDCKEEKLRILALTWFSGQMGSGKVVFSGSETGKGEPIQPGSIAESLWKIACGKK